MLQLQADTPHQWVQPILANWNAFLIDHAACERKASAMAMNFVARYPDKPAIVESMIALAIEELEHFQGVVTLMMRAGLAMEPDTKDAYVNLLLAEVRTTTQERLLDRLLVAAIIEARGCERFGIVAEALPEGELKTFYMDIARSEARHHGLFTRLARGEFPEDIVRVRMDELLAVEARVIQSLPHRAALH